MNDTLLLLVAGVLVWIISEGKLSTPTGTGAPAPKLPGLGTTDPNGGLGPFSPVLNLPVLKQAYQVLAPIEKHVVAPAVDTLNQAFGINYVRPNADGSITAVHGPLEVTTNPDGTQTRKFHAQLTYGQAWHKATAATKVVVAVPKKIVATTAHGLQSGAKAATHAVSSGASKVLGWL